MMKYFILLLLLFTNVLYASNIDERNTNLQKRLRCVTCPNQAVYDSNAPVAEAIKREIIEQLDSGKSDAEIEDYFIARYGEFVLYEPQLALKNTLLWVSPFLVMALLLFYGFRVLRNTNG